MSDSLRLASFAEWAVPAGVLLLLLMAGMWQLYGLLFLDLAGWMGLPDGSVALAGPHAELLPREAVLVGLRLGACWVLWQLLRRPERDALRVNTP